MKQRSPRGPNSKKLATVYPRSGGEAQIREFPDGRLVFFVSGNRHQIGAFHSVNSWRVDLSDPQPES
ncbi:MAG: hypothetical protein J2P45_05865 [Candidatus Dormibacteraeota bacterium]|nr:hypothetical protein [Candidatus Dormibacteraeota bacterium]